MHSYQGREAIYKVVLSSYDAWHDTLDKASSLYDLLEAFPDPDFSYDFEQGKIEIRESLSPIVPGEEMNQYGMNRVSRTDLAAPVK